MKVTRQDTEWNDWECVFCRNAIFEIRLRKRERYDNSDQLEREDMRNTCRCDEETKQRQNKEGRTTEGLALRSLKSRVESLVRENFMQLPLTIFFAISAYSLYTSSATQTARVFEKPLRVPRA